MNPAGSQELDKSWDGWMDTLSASYAKSTALLAEKNTEAAAQEYRTGVAATVRKIYTEVASTPPARFEKLGADGWTAWARKLYANMRQTEDVLAGRTQGDAAKLLAELRGHFYKLHEQSGALKANDFIYEFNRTAGEEKIKPADLKKLAEKLEAAKLSRQARADAKAYEKAKGEWAAAVGPILSDGKVADEERDGLRSAADKFYKAFGIQFE